MTINEQKITPFLWFDKQAEEAANFYVSIFKGSKILNTSHYSEGAPLPAGTVMTVDFELQGQRFVGLNGGPVFNFTPAVSFSINCKDSDEVDYFWSRLTEGGEEGQCGWLVDKFGVSWQVVPSELGELMSNPDPVKATKVVQAMMKMKKIDVKVLKEAAES